MLDWVASTKFVDERYSDGRRMPAYLYRSTPLSPSIYVMWLSITAVLRKPLSATRKPRSVSSSGLSFGPAAARMPLKKFAGIELLVILHGGVSITVEILRKRDPRDSVLFPSAVVYNSERLVPLELGCRKLFAHVNLLRGGC